MIVTSTSASEIRIAGIHQRRDRLALHGRDDLRVLDVAAQHRVEVAAALAGQQRRRVDAGKQVAVRGERVRQRRARSHLLVHVVEHRRNTGDVDAPLQEVERLDQRHAGLEQRGQFLVEDEELAGVDRAAAAAAGARRPPMAPFGWSERTNRPFSSSSWRSRASLSAT